MSEKFKPKECKDFPGFYEIPGYPKHGASKKGFILTKKTGNNTKGSFSGRYRRVSVYKGDSKEPILDYPHYLVCLAFYGKPKKGQVVKHGDNDRGNNHYKNVSWGSQSENIQDAYDDGLITKESMPSINW